MKKTAIAIAIAIAATGGAHAQSAAWTLDVKHKFAGVENDSGATFGVTCAGGDGCRWILKTANRCVKGDSYPALSTAEAGAAAQTLFCLIPDGTYIIEGFDDITKMVHGGGIIAFALPTRSGKFDVVRFDTKGASDVMAKLADVVDAKPTNTRNTSL